MEKIETSVFLDDFEAEAKTHIDKIESAFLNAETLAGSPELLNGVFRAAHSIKGTAGFFSLKKIVSVAHELESVLSQIKDGHLKITDEIVDVVLQSIDCLKELIENIQDDDKIETGAVHESLKKFSVATTQSVEHVENISSIKIPFDLKDSETEKILKNAARFGHKIFYVDINFNRSLGKFYKHPTGMIESILSIGNLAEAMVGGGDRDQTGKKIKEPDVNLMTNKIVTALTESDTSTLKLLVTSVLDYDLFSTAVEIDKKNIHMINKESVFLPEGASAETEKLNSAAPVLNEDPSAFTETRTDPLLQNKKQQEKEDNFFVRLDISVINGLLDLANEMILTRNQLFSAMSGNEKALPGISPVMNDISRLTSEIQEKIMFTRMQPINVIFSKFPRIIRDTAKQLNKDIGVEIVRDDVTLDKYLLEALTDPITQLVKNSADHGLESAERRAESGKPSKGIITLNAYMRDGSAVIEVTDDGAGIDKDALKSKALERGIVKEDVLSSMNDTEIFNLMFEPGISTAKKVTNLSGRGVGMDIVKTNIEKLGGLIEIESEVGKGTTVRLKMPLTLSVIRTLIVKIDSIIYAVPELNVERIVRIWDETETKRIERINKSLVLSLDGRIIPIITMREIAAKAKGQEPVSVDDILERSRHNGVAKCLVLRADGKSFALLIDDALETEQVLVKSLPMYLQNCPCYSNVTVLGSGKAVTILDAEGIMRFMGIEHIEKETDEKVINTDNDEKQVIIFKCSGTEYYAVETGDISRIEVIDPDSIQEIGRGRFINIA
ncbi:MAG: chemotaxis protein CheA, partial [Defluviitaleaceae bacterium]|nr:chemotaxis protein CheA [Defluviitaleaceae bacterium]